MSLKTFDKFCEDIIMGNKQEKAIYDERQNQVQTKLLVEALLVYIAAVFVNTLFMDFIYRWCDSYFAPMVLLAGIVYLYWIIRSAAKGCLVGVNGSRPIKMSAFMMIFLGGLYSVNFFFNITEKNGIFLDGKAEMGFIFGVYCVLTIICGIIMMIFAKRYDKKQKDISNNQD